MLQNFIVVTLRNLRKRKVFTTIHILGLSVAFAAAILLFLTAMFELSYDDFHANRGRIGMVYDVSNPTTGKEYGETKPIPFGPTLKAEIPAVERMSRFGNGAAILRHGDKQFVAAARFVDPDFLHMFSFSLQHGNASALDALDNIVISETMAKNLFGHTDVIGESIEAQINGQWQSKVVTAVTTILPQNSSLTFNTLLRFEHMMPDYQGYLDNWGHANHSVFIQWAGDKLDPVAFNRQARPFMATHYEGEIANLKRDGASPDEHGEYLALHVLPMGEYHLNSLGIGGGGPPMFPWMLLLIATLILFIAGSNFVNLSLAGSFTRSREIGMRKTLGGRPWQLMAQLWGESLLVCLFALTLGGLLAWALLPQYNANMNYSLAISQLFAGWNLPLFLATFLFLTAISGGYPAWLMARINTIQTLKGKLQLNAGGGLRSALTVVQFAIAVVLIIGTLVMSSQLHYLHTRPLGFNKTEVISIPIGDEIDKETALKRMRAELASLPQVESLSGSDINIGRGSDGGAATSRVGFGYEDRTIRTHWLRVDYDYLSTLDLQLVAGRDFSRDFATDTNAVLINEQMAAQLGGIDKILGQTIPVNDGMQVIGVVKDYNFKDLRQQIEPLTMFINPNEFPLEYLFVKVRPENLATSLAAVEAVWKKVNPRATDGASYLDENTDNQYRRDQRFTNIIISGATLAILISCMGLFAIALLSINRRVKEIGVRKVLGASVAGIIVLLSRDFIKMVGIAFVIGAPVAWWAANKWLESFAYRIDVNAGLLILGGAIVLLVALATVITQSLRAALANPVESLRDE
ncbi:ABC transporter permease [Parapedobacter koreensis]|uniref:ABC-type transport system, involved in lipoprotein release, permease component n=1 Tax=Parapedobacter koreensis TaxID=332977 RepID=A0A1H7QWG6_9SPHI|nr:ABC transporter permease [Parapedobacter koreensis]SEL52350.1 ABC-type transport system, involved in lipoprotein release, permease component [Parapedobacter koreensis]